MKTKIVKVTKDNLPELRQELNWHMKSLTLMREQEYIRKCAPKK